MDKQAIAQSIRDKRNSYTVMERAYWDKKIHDTVLDYCSSHQTIGIYAAFNGEVDTYGIIETLLWDKSKTIVLPRIENGTMNFYKINDMNDLQPGHFGVLEPIGTETKAVDIMIVPLSAFNTECHRIGYGKGYYDRYFEMNKCIKVGIAYDFQKVEIQFQDDNDVALDAIVTERAVYHVEKY